MAHSSLAAAAGSGRSQEFSRALEAYVETLTSNFSSTTVAQPEDQLKAPVSKLVATAAELLGLDALARTEVQVAEVKGRPDIGVDISKVICGHIELKAPGNGSDPSKFKDKRSRDQFERFRGLPNLIYTDGRDWALYRRGDRVSRPVSLSFDPTDATPDQISSSDADQLFSLLISFLKWEPVVPNTPKALAGLIAPITRYLRDEVLLDVENGGPLALLAAEWKSTLFPDSDDAGFADGYAQTFTYSLLLARLEGASRPISAKNAAAALEADHSLLAQALSVLGQPGARDAIDTSVSLLERIIDAVDPDLLKENGDPWLYFYEDFIAEYDSKQRGDKGVYYTPFEIVDCQVRLTDLLLKTEFGLPDGFGSQEIKVLDPAAGTSTYPLAIITKVLNEVEEFGGKGLVPQAAQRLSENLYAFETLVGPYAVSHLRLSRVFSDSGASLDGSGVNVFLTDTLAAPAHEELMSRVPLFTKKLAEEQSRASRVKGPDTEITVVIGNPPWDRDSSGEADTTDRKGGMVRHGWDGNPPLLEDFLNPLTAEERRTQPANLYNDYVYFWRWAIWKVCEQQSESAGIISFITPSAWLHGKVFAGMREVLRKRFDKIWVVDLGGDSRSKPPSENVFLGVQTPNAMIIAIRLPATADRESSPAEVRYTKLSGAREEKLVRLLDLRSLTADDTWEECESSWGGRFSPKRSGLSRNWVNLEKIFPWSARGLQFSRTWPIGENKEVLKERWEKLVTSPQEGRGALMYEASSTRVNHATNSLFRNEELPAIEELTAKDGPEPIERLSYRSFDTRWCIADPRLIERSHRSLWASLSDHQVFFTRPDSQPGAGPLLVANAFVPDLNGFNGRGGLVWPLLKDQAGQKGNVSIAALAVVSEALGETVSANELAAYVLGVMGTGALSVARPTEMQGKALSVPITSQRDLFREAAALGDEICWWSTGGRRSLLQTDRPKKRPVGTAKNTRAVPPGEDHYPNHFEWLAEDELLRVGEGEFRPVVSDVWNFDVGGMKVLKNWLASRMRDRSGRKSSELDEIRPTNWEFSMELVELLAILEFHVETRAKAADVVGKILEQTLIDDAHFPVPENQERREPRVAQQRSQNLLF